MQRRAILAITGLGIGGALTPARAQMQAQTNDAIRRLVGTAEPQAGRVTIRVPSIAENGNAVPVNVSVESSMTADSHVRAIHILADRNPAAEVASFRLTPSMGRAQAETRIRLSETQDVIALAEMNDGSIWMARAEVKVTIGGCGG